MRNHSVQCMLDYLSLAFNQHEYNNSLSEQPLLSHCIHTRCHCPELACCLPPASRRCTGCTVRHTCVGRHVAAAHLRWVCACLHLVCRCVVSKLEGGDEHTRYPLTEYIMLINL